MTLPHVPWPWLLVAYLWLTGGKGWVVGYEFSVQRPLKPLPRALAHMLWPVFTGISIVGEWWSHLRPGKR